MDNKARKRYSLQDKIKELEEEKKRASQATTIKPVVEFTVTDTPEMSVTFDTSKTSAQSSELQEILDYIRKQNHDDQESARVQKDDLVRKMETISPGSTAVLKSMETKTNDEIDEWVEMLEERLRNKMQNNTLYGLSVIEICAMVGLFLFLMISIYKCIKGM